MLFFWAGLGWGTFFVFVDDGDFDGLLRAVKRLALNDAAIEWEREQSPALGMGLRMGFLGVLHMEVGVCDRSFALKTWSLCGI